jgi:methyltransferase family protein
MAVVGLGCGKGLPLLVAARLGFAEIIGVEFAPKLAAIARPNAEIMGIKNISVDVACSNIVLFLFNHFGDHARKRSWTISKWSRSATPLSAHLFISFTEIRERCWIAAAF